MDYWLSAVYAVCYSNDMKGAKNHVSNCCFFLTKCFWPFLQKQEANIEYPILRPLPNDDSLPVGLPNPRAVFTIGDIGENVKKGTEDCIDPDFQPLQCREPHLITQPELKFNNLVRD